MIKPNWRRADVWLLRSLSLFYHWNEIGISWKISWKWTTTPRNLHHLHRLHLKRKNSKEKNGEIFCWEKGVSKLFLHFKTRLRERVNDPKDREYFYVLTSPSPHSLVLHFRSISSWHICTLHLLVVVVVSEHFPIFFNSLKKSPHVVKIGVVDKNRKEIVTDDGKRETPCPRVDHRPAVTSTATTRTTTRTCHKPAAKASALEFASTFFHWHFDDRKSISDVKEEEVKRTCS